MLMLFLSQAQRGKSAYNLNIRHCSLHLRPGLVRVQHQGQEEVFYISVGMLEVQPYIVTVLADTVIRAHDIDEAAALEAKERAEVALEEHKADEEHYQFAVDLAKVVAQIRAIKRIRKK
jgi:F-type H+-transporting ATPase subunit epsilon